MFRKTLDISYRLIRTVSEKSFGGFLNEDERGKHDKHYSVDETIKNNMRDYIKNIPKIESNYLRQQTTREYICLFFFFFFDEYIDGGKTIADLHRDYVDQCKRDELSYGNYVMFSRIFNGEFNLGIFVPKKDRCELCVAYENANFEDELQLDEKFDEHLVEKKLSREEKKTDQEA